MQGWCLIGTLLLRYPVAIRQKNMERITQGKAVVKITSCYGSTGHWSVRGIQWRKCAMPEVLHTPREKFKKGILLQTVKT